MSTEIRLEFNPTAALEKRGLGPSDRAQRVFTSECARNMDPYVPMRDGTLKNTPNIQLDSVSYIMPYARYHYYGKLMLAPNGSAYAKLGERKALTTRDMVYHGAPMRGPFWDKRMWKDHQNDILDTTAKECGGTYK